MAIGRDAIIPRGLQRNEFHQSGAGLDGSWVLLFGTGGGEDWDKFRHVDRPSNLFETLFPTEADD